MSDLRQKTRFIKRAALAAVCVIAFQLVSAAQVYEQSPFKLSVIVDRLSFMEGEPVEVSLVVRNTSDRTASFSMYDVFYTTFQPVAYTMEGREVESTVQYRQMNRTVQDVVQYIEPRTVRIAPDEKIVKRIDLRNCYDFAAGSKYRVRAFFMPDAKTPFCLRSGNSVELQIVSAEREIDTTIKLPSQYAGGITPGEMIQLFLTAEKTRSWNNMLKYLQIEKYIAAYPDYAMNYNAGTDPVKRRVLRDFVTYLSTPRRDYIVDYSVISESILDGGKNAFVEAKVTRLSAPRPFVYTYKYSLESVNGSWLITGVDATVSKERILGK
jgi:hypothetical protein